MPKGPGAGFYYAIAAVPLMGAGIFGPEVLSLSAEGKRIAFFLCLVAAVVCVLIGTIKEAKAEVADQSQPGHRRRVIAIIGMFVCGIGFLGFATVYFWPNREGPNGKLPVAALSGPPSLLNLFMTDLRPSVGLMWNAFGDVEVQTDGDKSKVRIFYKIVNDTQANTKFIAFYVPNLGGAFHAVLTFLSKDYKGYFSDIESKHWAVMGSEGTSDAVNTKDIGFSGAIYIYHEDPLSAEELGEMTGRFRENGARVYFRGDKYVLAVWSSIRSGDIKAPPRFEIRNGLPVQVD
jgi:hypothetical protein